MAFGLSNGRIFDLGDGRLFIGNAYVLFWFDTFWFFGDIDSVRMAIFYFAYVVFLPSSISEVIVVAQTAGEPETLLAMVHEINEMEVALEERLTDSIYPMCLADGEYRLSVIRPR